MINPIHEALNKSPKFVRGRNGATVSDAEIRKAVDKIKSEPLDARDFRYDEIRRMDADGRTIWGYARQM